MKAAIGGGAFFLAAGVAFACGSPSGEAKLQSQGETTSDAGSQEDAAPNPERWGRADAAAERDTGAHRDAGNGQNDASRSDDGTAYTLGAIACGVGNACGTSKPVCCVDDVDENVACQPADQACSGFTMTCDGPEDCAMGEVCCATGSKIACDEFGASHCPSGPGGQSSTIACHTDADCKGSAPVCEREHMAQIDIRICHRACNTAEDCKPWGMLYCYAAADSTAPTALCHSWPAPHGL